MADKKISQLSSASTPLAGTEVLPIVQSSTTVKVSVADLTAGRAVAASALTVSGDAAVGGTAALSTSAGRVYLVVRGTGTAAGNGNGVLQFQSNSAGSLSPNVGNIEWNLPDNTVSSSTRVSFISSSIDGATAGNRGSYMAFATKTDNVSGAGAERMRITSDGKVYIAGTVDQGAYNLQVNGTGVWGAGAYVNGSDERIKDDILPLTAGLDVVVKLNPVQFRYKDSWSSDTNLQPGFIAQDLQTALADQPYVDGVVMQGREYMCVAYQSLIPLLTKAIQEQQALIEGLKARVTVLESR